MYTPRTMIPFEEAFRIAMEHVRPMPVEVVPLPNALGRILARDVVSDMDFPPFRKSAMDGFACRRADLDKELLILETIPAGRPPTRPIEAGECSRIMTGAMVPEGADLVFMVEDSELIGEDRVRFTGGQQSRDNIMQRAEDLETGATVLRPGIRIEPRHVAVLAAVGCAEVPVYRQARVGILATGDELVEPAEKPDVSRIRNSNGPQLTAQTAAMGAVPIYLGIGRDNRKSLEEHIDRALADCDVLLLSGGVSMGEFDLVPEVLKDRGVEILYDQVRIKPGKPTTFGIGPEIRVFGLPGNPVSTYVIFEVLVKPFLLRTCGHEAPMVDLPATLSAGFRRKRAAREEWVPVRRTGPSTVEPVPYHGSAHFLALPSGDALMRIPPGVKELPEGAEVRVRPL